MPKKQWSEEERKAFGAKMRAIKQAKQVDPEPILDTVEAKPEASDPGNIQNSDYADLVKQMNELKAYLFDMKGGAPTPAGITATGQGLIGTFEKYILDPARYPDPSKRLAKEPKLARFAFDMNYELDWNVGVSSYKTIDGINTKEPKFTISLHRVIMDEDTGEPTPGRYVISTAVFHEDPDAALVVARENGIAVDESDEKKFLDEMRYLRVRDWLIECFYTPLITGKKTNKKEMVVGGKIVQYFEISSEDSSGIPFNELNGKV